MRIVIIGFALAMVVIGVYPFRRQFRSQFHEVRAVVRRELGEYIPASSSDRGGQPAEQPEARAALRRSELEPDEGRRKETSRAAREQVAPKSLPSSSPARHLDRLSEDDRRALDRVLNDQP